MTSYRITISVKGNKHHAEETEDSGEGNGGEDDKDDQDDGEVSPQRNQKKNKSCMVESGGEETAGISKRKGKGKQKVVDVVHIDDEDVEEQVSEIVDNFGDKNEQDEAEEEVSSRLITDDHAAHLVAGPEHIPCPGSSRDAHV